MGIMNEKKTNYVVVVTQSNTIYTYAERSDNIANDSIEWLFNRDELIQQHFSLGFNMKF